MKLVLILFLALGIFAQNSCSTVDEEGLTNDKNQKTVDEVKVQKIKLPSPLSQREFECSGLAWFEDNLIFLPQYPHLFSEENDGVLFFAKKETIKDYLFTDKKDELIVSEVPFIAEGLDAYGKVRGSGYEAITFHNNEVFVSIESIENNGISSFLVKGKVYGQLDSIVLDASTLTAIKSNTNLNNIGEEAITFWNNNIYAFHEANGANLLDTATAFYTNFTEHSGTIKFPTIEFRITDATDTDNEGKFWGLNYFFPGDINKLDPAEDKIADLFGIGSTNSKSISIERILEFKFESNQIIIAETPPIYLEIEDLAGRNWEGIVKIDDIGFLVITDYFPQSIFGFVPKKIE